MKCGGNIFIGCGTSGSLRTTRLWACIIQLATTVGRTIEMPR